MKKIFNFMVRLLITSALTFIILLIMFALDSELAQRNEVHLIFTVFIFMPYVIYNYIRKVKNIKRFIIRNLAFKVYLLWSIIALFNLNFVGGIIGILVYCLYKHLIKDTNSEIKEKNKKENDKETKNSKKVLLVVLITLVAGLIFKSKKVNLKDMFNKFGEAFN